MYFLLHRPDNISLNVNFSSKHVIYLPFRLDIWDCSDIVFGCEYELVVEHPLGFVVQTGGGVQLYHLVVLDCQVMTRPFKVGNLK